MSNTSFVPEGRNYPQLFVALDDAIAAVLSGHGGEGLLEGSFSNVADGFGAERALVLAVEPEGRLRALASRGLSREEVAACEAGGSVSGISSSKIRETLGRRSPLLVQDPRHLVGPKMTRALEGKPFSVLCAPIVDPSRSLVLGIFYAQNSGFENAFTEIDFSFIEVWANVMGRLLSAGRVKSAGPD